jgi:flagellin-like hook-associated protein FlgL
MVDFTKKQTEQPIKRLSLFGSKPITAEVKAQPVVAPVVEQKPTIKQVFGSNPANALVDKAIEYIKSNYKDVFTTEEINLRSLVRRLALLDLVTVTTWGDDQLAEQRKTIQLASSRINEFYKLNCTTILSEAIDVAQNRHKSFLDKFKKTDTKEVYLSRIEEMKVRLKGLLPDIEECKKKTKTNVLVLHLIALASVNETSKGSDVLIEEALYERRRLIQGAIQNVEVVNAKLDQVRSEIVSMQNQIEHTLSVTFASLDLTTVYK